MPQVPQRGLYPDELEPVVPAAPTPAPVGAGRSLYPDADPDPLAQTVKASQTLKGDPARLLLLKQKTGYETGYIEHNIDAVEREVSTRDFDTEHLRKAYPKLSAWMADDPVTAGAARKDLPNLQAIEHTLTFGQSVMRGIDQVQAGAGSFLEATGEATGMDALAKTGREIRERNTTEMDARGKRTSMYELRGPWDLAQWVKESIGENLPNMSMSVAGGVAGGAVGSVVPGIGTTLGAAIGAFAPNLVLSVGEVQGNLKQAAPGSSSPAAAFIGGSAVAALDTILPGKIGGRLARTFGLATAEKVAAKALLEPVKRSWIHTTAHGVAEGVTSEGLTEALQEAIGAVAVSQGTGLELDTSQTAWQALEAGATGAVVGGAFGGGGAAVTHPLEQRRQAKVAAAQPLQPMFDALAKATSESEFLKNHPEAAEQFFQRVTRDGPIAFVYAPTEAFVEHVTASGQSPSVVAADLTGRPTALEDAVRDGTDLQIPTAAYAAKIAPTDMHKGLSQELRLGDARQMNLREVDELATTPAEVSPGEDVRQQVEARLTAQLVAGGIAPEQAQSYAGLQGQRLIARAERLGVDPLELATAQPLDVVVSEAENAGLTGSQVTVPESPAPKGETRDARGRRRQVHVAALTKQVLEQAQRIDPNVDPEVIAKEVSFRMALAEDQQALQRESGNGPDLLRAIAEYGGIRRDEAGNDSGEFRHFAVEGKDKRGPNDRGFANSWNGVEGVFDVKGDNDRSLTFERMARSLMQDPRFEHLGDDPNRLIDAIDQALRAPADVDAFPGTEGLRDLGIDPATKWWSDAWSEPQVSDAVDTGGDASFDPAAFQQRKLTEARQTARRSRIVNSMGPHARNLLQDEDGDVQGVYTPDLNRIRLVAGTSDLSTFLHESGHQFLEELMSDAASVGTEDQGDGPRAKLRSDAAAVLKWFGFDGSIEDWQQRPLEERRSQHEAFARGFEAYLFEGKAPNVELRSLFAQFRTWLTGVYRSILRLRASAGQDWVEPTPEIRGVMDRLLATDDAIAAAQGESEVTPLFTDAASAGVNDLTFAAYRDVVAAASTKAREDVDRRLMAEYRETQQAWWKEARLNVREQVANEASQEPALAAQAVMRTGKLPNGQIPEYGDGAPMKASKDDIVRQFGKDRLNSLRMGKDYLYAVKDGLQVDTLATLMGFPSGDALLTAVSQSPRVEHVIELETDRRMREQHGDTLLQGVDLKEMAEGAVHEHRADIISAELNALTKGMAGAAIPDAQALKAAAEARIAQLPIRQLRPGQFLQAAVRASKQAFDAFAKNDRAGAITAKQQELAALAQYRAARDLAEKVTSHRKKLVEYDTNSKIRGRIARAGQPYIDAIDQLLERYEFKRVPLRTLDRRQSLRAFVASQERDNLPIDIPESVIEDARSVNWQELSVEEFEGVYQSVEHIAHLARFKHGMLKDKAAREFQVVRDSLDGSIREHKGADPQPLSVLPGERGKRTIADISTAHLKIATLARIMDGFKAGPMYDHVIRPLADAAHQKLERKAEAGEALSKIFDKHYTAAEQRSFYTREYLPALGAHTDPTASISKMERLMVLLNWGNETNRQRVRDGRGWSNAQVQAILDTLDKKDGEFAQDVWNYFETFRPEIAAKELRVKGFEPEWVEPTPVFTRHGELKGGYFPIVYDTDRSAPAGAHEDASMADLAKTAAYVHSIPRRGHLQRRAENDIVRPVKLTFDVIFQHVERVIHDLTHHEVLVDVGRLLDGQKGVGQAIVDTHGAEVYRQFKNTLKDVALGEAPARDALESIAGKIRNGGTAVGLAWGVTTALQQPLGVANTVERVGVKWAIRGFTEILGTRRQLQQRYAWMMERSPLMRTRYLNLNREIHDLRTNLGLNDSALIRTPGTWLDIGLRGVTGDRVTAAAITNSYFSLIAKMQMPVDMHAWYSAYHQAMADPTNVKDDGTVDEERAYAMADQTVTDVQGGGTPMDLASVQRGSAWLKLFTSFYSFMNVSFNLMTLAKREAQYHADRGERALLNPVTIAKLVESYVLIFVVPAVIGSVIKNAASGEDDPEDYMKDAARDGLMAPLGSMVLLREFAGLAAGFAGYEGPAGLRGISAAGKFMKQAGTAIAEGDPGKITTQGLRALNTTAGVMLNYPAAQVDRTMRGAYALAEGETENPLALLFGPPKKD